MVLGDEFDRFPKRKVLLFHDKGDGIATPVATEAMEQVLLG